MAQAKVLISDKLSQDGVAILQERKELQVDIKTGLSPAELAKEIKGYDALVIRSATKVTKEVLDAADNLKVIGRAGVGVDNVDIPEATKRGIIVMNVPAGNTISTAEHTVAMICAMSRQIAQANASLRQGLWERPKFVGTELFTKTLGVVGLGKIGLEVARRMQAMGMEIIGYDPFLSEERAEQLGIQLVRLGELYAKADYITVHVPLNDETRNMITTDEIGKMKDGVRLINCARGGIMNEQDVADALKSGKIGGVAFDVYPEEPPPKDHPLIGLENALCTPHLGASTREAQENVAVEVAKQVADALLGGGIRNAVNMPSVDAKTLQVLQPYILLGERLGSLASQLTSGSVSQVSVTFVGEVTGHDTSAVTLSVLKGILTPMVGENVNYVNASVIAAERGIKVVESKASRLDEFADLIAVEVTGSGSPIELQGTLSARREPRLVKISPYFVEASPQGAMLLIKNHDKPGLIGSLGTLLAKSDINIASMSNGRDVPGGEAITVLNIDQPVPEDVMTQVKDLPNVIDAKAIKL